MIDPKNTPVPWFEAQIFPHIGWVRVFGHGVHYKWIKKHGLIFSERHGYVRGFRLFGWQFRYMEPRR